MSTLPPIPLVVMFWAGLLTVVGTYAACDRVAARLRRARHHRATRRNGRMLSRPSGGVR